MKEVMMARQPDPQKAVLWRQRLRRFQHSGLSIARFCAQEGCSDASFYQWRKRLAKTVKGATRSKPPASFHAVQILPARLPISIQFPGGTRIEMPAENLPAVRAVVRELARADRRGEEGDAAC